MNRCIIITPCLDTAIKDNIHIHPDDFIICADAGFDVASCEKIVPDVIMGDFDSLSRQDIYNLPHADSNYANIKISRSSPEKDDTDTMLCVKHGLENGYREFIILGGLHGRLDHTIANIQALSYILDNDGSGWIMDGANRATMMEGPDELSLSKDVFNYFSIFSYSEECKGVYEINSKYTLDNVILNQSFPIGTSNEFTDGPALIKLREGKLLIIKSI